MDDAESRRNVEIMADRLARLYYWTAKTLIDKFGEKEAENLLKKIISDYGKETGELTRRAVEEQGFEPTVDNYARGKDLPTIGWEGETLESTPDSLITKTTYCPIAASWKKHYSGQGFEKFARIYCSIDSAKYEAYDTKCRCISEKNVLVGDEYCLVKTSR